MDYSAFFTADIGKFGVLIIKVLFSNDTIMHKCKFTTCAAIRRIILDLIPHMLSESSIQYLKRFVIRRGCPECIISDNVINFIAQEARHFVSNLIS